MGSLYAEVRPEILCGRICELEAENAKLRELVARMARALRIGGDWCDRDCLAEFGCTDSCPIADAMHEMGIEMDG